MTAICANNLAVAKSLIENIQLPTPPPVEQSILQKGALESWYWRREDEPSALWAGLIAADWVEASPSFIILAIICPDAAAGLAIFEALRARGVKIEDGHKALRGAELAEMALGHCP